MVATLAKWAHLSIDFSTDYWIWTTNSNKLKLIETTISIHKVNIAILWGSGALIQILCSVQLNSNKHWLNQLYSGHKSVKIFKIKSKILTSFIIHEQNKIEAINIEFKSRQIYSPSRYSPMLSQFWFGCNVDVHPEGTDVGEHTSQPSNYHLRRRTDETHSQIWPNDISIRDIGQSLFAARFLGLGG